MPECFTAAEGKAAATTSMVNPLNCGIRNAKIEEMQGKSTGNVPYHFKKEENDIFQF